MKFEYHFLEKLFVVFTFWASRNHAATLRKLDLTPIFTLFPRIYQLTNVVLICINVLTMLAFKHYKQI